jgi:hypothetical protein
MHHFWETSFLENLIFGHARSPAHGAPSPSPARRNRRRTGAQRRAARRAGGALAARRPKPAPRRPRSLRCAPGGGMGGAVRASPGDPAREPACATSPAPASCVARSASALAAAAGAAAPAQPPRELARPLAGGGGGQVCLDMSNDSSDVSVTDVFIYRGWYRRIALYQISPLLNRSCCGSESV